MAVYKSFGKRVFDVVGAVALLPLLGVVSIIVAPAIVINDRGPILFVGERRGMNGRHFAMYKFRSMYVNAPDVRNSDFSTLNSDTDPRVTRVGRILRKTSVDELPQILNVLKGDMSFVGPRPNMTSQSWESLSALERKRLQVRPGLTGLAQALRRNSAMTQEKYQIDERYVDTLSLLLDVKILLRTIVTVVSSRNINSTVKADSN